MTQAGPYAFHRVAVYPGTVGGTTSVRAGAMVDRPMVLVSLGARVDGGCIGEARRPGFSLGGNKGFDRRGAYVREHCERDVRGWRVLVCLVAAVHPAQEGGTARLGGGAPTKLEPALSRCAFVAFDCTGQSLAACPLVACIRCHVGLQLAGRLQMVRLVEATIQSMDTPLRGPLLDISGSGKVGGVQLQRPPAHHQHPCQGASLALLEDRPGPVREHGTLLAPAPSAGPTGEALQSVVAPCSRLHRIVAAAWARDAIGPTPWSQISSSFPAVLQVRYQVFHEIAPLRCEQPHDTDATRLKLL